MNECVDYKKLFTAGTLITVAILLGLIQYRDLTLGFNYGTLAASTMAATTCWILWVFFKKWLWRLPLLQGWLVKIPNLNGSWSGEMRSTWLDPKTNKGIPAIVTTAKITQTLTEITIDFQTGEMESQSVVATVSCDPHRRITEIKYIYQSEPEATVRHRSEMHYGAAKLGVRREGSKLTLRGDYWTSRKTTGTIELTKNRK